MTSGMHAPSRFFGPMSDRCSVPTPDIVQLGARLFGVANTERRCLGRSNKAALECLAVLQISLRTACPRRSAFGSAQTSWTGGKILASGDTTCELRRYGRRLGAANKALSMSPRPNRGLNRRHADTFSPTVSSAPRAAPSASGERRLIRLRRRPVLRGGRPRHPVCLTTGIKLRGPEGAQRLRATSASMSELCGLAPNHCDRERLAVMR